MPAFTVNEIARVEKEEAESSGSDTGSSSSSNSWSAAGRSGQTPPPISPIANLPEEDAVTVYFMPEKINVHRTVKELADSGNTKY